MPVDVRKAVDAAQRKAIGVIVGEVKGRIQQEGHTADNRPIGQYSARYARVRKEAGLQVDKIDITFTGKLLNSFRSGTDLKTGSVVLGFDDYNIRTTTTKEGKTYTANLVEIYTTDARWTEHGAIFQLSKEEIELYNDAFRKFFDEEIRIQRGK